MNIPRTIAGSAALAVCGVAAYGLRHLSLDVPPPYWGGILAAVTVHAAIDGLLPRPLVRSAARRLWRPTASLALVAVVLVVMGYFLKISDTYSRLWSVYWLGSAWLCLSLLETLIPAGPRHKRLILVGDAATTGAFGQQLKDDGLAVFSTMTMAELLDWLASRDDIPSHADEIVLVGAIPTEAERSALILALHGRSIGLRYCVDLGPVLHTGGDGCVAGRPTVPLLPSMSWSDNAVKRLEDLILGGVLLVLLLPVLAVIALLIRREGPGPVLFRQRRLGMGGKAFTIYKFRTMTPSAGAEAEAPQVKANDRRVTRIGAVLRRYGLDELPQIFNVMRGDMSLVGPRPHAFPHDVKWSETVRGYTRRLQVRPGITGLAQIRGYHGLVEKQEEIEARVSLDLDYIRSWSLWLDLEILALTIPTLIRRSQDRLSAGRP